MTRSMVAQELVRIANRIAAEEGGDEEKEKTQAFSRRLIGLKTMLAKLVPIRRKKLKNYGVGVIRPTTTSVEDLVGILEGILAQL